MRTKEEYDRRKADQNADKEKRIAQSWRNKMKDPITLFTGVLAIVAILQLLAIFSTDRATHEIAKAALTQADEAGKQVSVMQRQLDRDNRAQIFAIQATINAPPQANVPLSGNMVLINSGRGDAKILFGPNVAATNLMFYWSKFLPADVYDGKGYPAEFGPCSEPRVENHLIMDQSAQLKWCFTQKGPRLLDKKIVEQIMSGTSESKLWVVGIIQYNEWYHRTRTEGSRHVTFVCREYDPTSNRLKYTDDKECNLAY